MKRCWNIDRDANRFMFHDPIISSFAVTMEYEFFALEMRF